MLEFRTLGSIELRGEDGRSNESILRHPKRLSLLAYLCASYPPARHRRDTLVALLWPDHDEAHARGALRQELYQLRRALGPGVLLGERADVVGIDPHRLRCDAQEFEAALDEGRPVEALTLCHGEFLPGLHVDGGEFERWLDRTRDRLSRRAAEAARQLSEGAEQAADDGTALSWARRLTELAPSDETAWQRLIVLLNRQGDRAGALLAYDSLATRLRDDVGVEPSPETRAIIERIRGRSEPTAGRGSVGSAGQAGSVGRPPQTARAVIGLLPVENGTGDPGMESLARRVTDRLARGLAGAMFVDVAQVGETQEVTALVSASLLPRGEMLEVVSRLVEPGDGGRLVEVPRSVQLPPDPPDTLLDTLVAHVLVSVAAHYDPRFDAAATPARALPIRTPLWEAYLEYLQGSELFGQAQFLEGHRHLLRAYEIDSDFVKAGVFAAIALAATGAPTEADALATSVMAAARPLYPYERALGEWFLADLHGRRAEAHRAAVEGTRVSGSPVFQALAGREALRMNRPREALRLVEGFEYGQGWWRNGTVIIETTCGAHHVLGNHRAELVAAQDARARFPGSLAAIGVAVRAQAALGESDRVLGLVDEALTLPSGMTSPADVAWIAAQELDAHGHDAAGQTARRTALDWLTRRARPSTAERQLQVRLLLETGDIDEASRVLTELSPFNELESLGLAGLAAAQRGDAAAAGVVVADLERLQNPYLGGRHLFVAAGIQGALGPPDAAIATLRHALADGHPFGVELHALPTLRPLAKRGDFRALLHPRD